MPEEESLSLRPDHQKLPRGRAALPGTEVEKVRRARILQAVIDEVAESGYAAATVTAITKRARVSRSSFYAAFHDKEDAFSAAYRDATALIGARVWEPLETDLGDDFAEIARTVIAAYVNALEMSPAFTICFYLELRGAGERVLSQRAELIEANIKSIGEISAALAAVEPGIRAPGPGVLRGLLGGLDELVAHETRSQRGCEVLDLSEVVESFWELAMAVFTGHQ